MKKLLAIAAISILTAAASVVSAQTSMVSQYAKTIDTVTNTGVKYLYLNTVPSTYYKTVDIWVTYTKISGTLGGNLALEYSGDGVNYSQGYDTVLSVSDAATITKYWSLKDKSIKYIRVRSTGSGTMSSQIKALFWGKKENT